MKVKFYTYHPRGFENEYTAIKVTTEEESYALDNFGMEKDPYKSRLEKRTAKELRHMAAVERQARKDDPMFSGYCNLEPITVTEFLREEKLQ